MIPPPAAATVCLRPSGRTIRVTPGTTLYVAARQAGLPVGASCSRRGACGRCRVTVLEGQVAPPDERELALLHKLKASSTERIACRARVLGPVTITTGYW